LFVVSENLFEVRLLPFAAFEIKLEALRKAFAILLKALFSLLDHVSIG
jgi:hypothetical protein